LITEIDRKEVSQITHQLNPLTDARWSQLLERDERSSVFHSVNWLRALQKTYGYEPLAFSTAAPGAELTNALVFARVKSWLTGKRLVSLPFSDHCEPLVENLEQLNNLLEPAKKELSAGAIKYIDVRPLSLAFGQSLSDETFFIHLLDLRPTLDELYKKLHGDSIRRKIQRAEREKLTLDVGSSEALLQEFYDLHVITRQRQEAPPHPLVWFRNVLACLGEAAQIRVARKDGKAIAAIFTLAHKNKMVYKYGCSDAHSHNQGGMQFLFWSLIRYCKENGFVELDFGRSECANAGLVTFKDRWGAKRQPLVYLRYPERAGNSGQKSSSAVMLGKKLFARFPQSALRIVGNLLYPHVG
jgi:CelD/BcsL family acetyltransferase involved in cellulose biosynthesis